MLDKLQRHNKREINWNHIILRIRGFTGAFVNIVKK